MSKKNKKNPKIYYREVWPLALIYIAAVTAIWTGLSWWAVGLCLLLTFVRMFFVTAGYHRYFSHKSFKTSRVFQFVLAFMAQTSFEQGVVWWANHHRQHHKYSDTENDAHSPRNNGFWYAHFSWIYTKRFLNKKYNMVNDLMKYPELVWLDKYHWVPGVSMAAIVGLLFGWQGLVVGFIWSTILVHHFTYSVNSFCHMFGKQRYITGDDSRNNWLISIITLGEGWHNNHHFYPSSARQGFYWWEIDITFYILKILSWLGIVWELRSPNELVLNDSTYVTQKARLLSYSLVNRTMNYAPLINYLNTSDENFGHNIQQCKQFLRKTKVLLENLEWEAKLLPPKLQAHELERIRAVKNKLLVLLCNDENMYRFQQALKCFLKRLRRWAMKYQSVTT